MKRLPIVCSLALFIMVMVGCGQGQPVLPQGALATAPPEPTAIPTITEMAASPPTTTTPIPTPAPSPTPAPPTALLVAQRHMRNGNYRAATATYEQILSQGPVELRAEAEFRLGEIGVRVGEYPEAVERLTAFIDAHPGHELVAWAHFLRADAYDVLDRQHLAMDDYRRYLNLRPGRIESYVHERIGDIQAALGRPEEALESYVEAIDTGREPAALLQLREKAAAGYLALGNPRLAAVQYEAILAAARDLEYQADVTYRLAEVLLAGGEQEAAYARFYQVFEQYAQTPQAFQAMLALSNAGQPTNAYQRGLASYFNEAYQAALDAFYAHLAALSQGQAPPLLYIYIGLSHQALGHSSEASQAFQEVLDRNPDDPLASQAFLEQGRTLFLAGDSARAALRYMELAEVYPDSPEAPEAVWRAAYLYETLGETERSLATYEILGRTHPGAEQAWHGLWRASMLARATGDDARAERLLGLLAAGGKGEMPAKGALWLGKLRAARGDLDEARVAWTLGAQADPDGYYGVRCADILLGLSPFQPPAARRLDADEPREVAEAEAWLVSTFGIDAEPPLWPLSPELEADPRLVRGEELWRLGWLQEARAEFNALQEAYAPDPLAIYRLAVYFRELGVYRSSLEAAARLINMARTNTLGAPRFIARLRFPVYYADLVVPNAELCGVDPLFVFSVIRLESLFEGFAVSYADAYGLMQIIPSTGEYIAGQLNWAGFSASQLYYPYVSVTFGVFHLAELLNTFEEDHYAALAGYNAGPGRAAAWLDQSGGDADMYVEMVDIEQTEVYIKLIYENYLFYRSLYSAQ
jgi:soluble lytic murein transglycosylase